MYPVEPTTTTLISLAFLPLNEDGGSTVGVIEAVMGRNLSLLNLGDCDKLKGKRVIAYGAGVT